MTNAIRRKWEINLFIIYCPQILNTRCSDSYQNFRVSPAVRMRFHLHRDTVAKLGCGVAPALWRGCNCLRSERGGNRNKQSGATLAQSTVAVIELGRTGRRWFSTANKGLAILKRKVLQVGIRQNTLSHRRFKSFFFFLRVNLQMPGLCCVSLFWLLFLLRWAQARKLTLCGCWLRWKHCHVTS